jgi:hypothetical protein
MFAGIGDQVMYLDERCEGDYRIYVGALEAPQGGGYEASVVIYRTRGTRVGAAEAYRDTRLCGGHRWESPDDALQFAMARGRDMVLSRSKLLHC